MTPDTPHGYEIYLPHDVIRGVATGPRSHVRVPLLTQDERDALLGERFSFEGALEAYPSAPAILFPRDAPGLVCAVHQPHGMLEAKLQTCRRGQQVLVLPGPEPALRFTPAQAAAWPFSFLAGLECAIRCYPEWVAWAAGIDLDTQALGRIVNTLAEGAIIVQAPQIHGDRSRVLAKCLPIKGMPLHRVAAAAHREGYPTVLFFDRMVDLSEIGRCAAPSLEAFWRNITGLPGFLWIAEDAT